MTEPTTDPTLAEIARNDQRQAQNAAVLNVSTLVALHYRNLTCDLVAMPAECAAELCSEMQGQLLMATLPTPVRHLSVSVDGLEDECDRI